MSKGKSIVESASERWFTVNRGEGAFRAASRILLLHVVAPETVPVADIEPAVGEGRVSPSQAVFRFLGRCAMGRHIGRGEPALQAKGFRRCLDKRQLTRLLAVPI